MHDMDLTPAQPREAGTPIKVCRADGSEVAVRLRLLSYDGCEFESGEQFAPGEAVTLHLYRMGCIRAHVVARDARIIEAAFDMDCPV